MTKRGCAAIASFCWIQPVALAWALFFLQLSSFVHGLAISTPAADQRPRAALVSLAHEHDLPAILSSIYQLEDTFNRRYHYDWVFFSTKPLSDDFRRQTSNATAATCIYEVISEGNWVVPQSASSSHLAVSHIGHGYVEDVSDVDQPAPLLREIYRWNSGPFARENRLRDYDWFWRIEPGAQFTHDIHFDVFRFMRDHEIAYCFNEALVDKEDMQTHSHEVKSFMDKHPDLLHAEADVSWLLGRDASTEPVCQEQDCLEKHCSMPLDEREIFEGSPSRVRRRNADWEQGPDDENDESSHSEAFASWLGSIYKTGFTGLSPTFDIGSLTFFRSQSHQELFNHLDSAGDFYYRRRRDMSVPTISASMFLPQKSVWSFRRKDAGHTSRPSLPEFTPDPELDARTHQVNRFVGARRMIGPQRPGSTQERDKNPGESMAERFALWELMAQDLSRQDAIPGLQSGYTVIDERNFSLR